MTAVGCCQIRRQRPWLQGGHHRQPDSRTQATTIDFPLPPGLCLSGHRRKFGRSGRRARGSFSATRHRTEGEWCGCPSELAVAAVNWAAARQGLGLGARRASEAPFEQQLVPGLSISAMRAPNPAVSSTALATWRCRPRSRVFAHEIRRGTVLFIRSSRPRNGWLWPIDRAGHLVAFRRQPLRSVEFGAGPFAVPTIHPPCVLPPPAWLQ